MATFQQQHKKAARALTQFNKAIAEEDLTDAAETEAVVGLFGAAGDVALGIWQELHRIADAMEVIAEPLANMVEEHHA
jgi:hypothetical protein